MATVGLLFGMEETFPPALRERIELLGEKLGTRPQELLNQR